MSNLVTINQIIHLAHSIGRWVSVTNGDNLYNLYECRLCEVYDQENNCDGCPVYEDTNHRNCDGTPYDAWWEHAYELGYYNKSTDENGDIVIDDKYIELAVTELEYLKRVQKELIGDYNETHT